MFVLISTLFLLAGAENVIACNMTVPVTFLPVPASYCDIGTYDKSSTIKNPDSGGGATFHYLWDSSKVTFTSQTSWRYNPYTRVIYFYLGGNMGIYPYLAYSSNSTILDVVTDVPINQYGYYPSDYTWAQVCAKVSSATPDVQLYNTVTHEFCGYVPKLTIIINPAESGTVTSNPAGIDCPSTSCQSAFGLNSNVDVTATPSTDWAFAYWEWNEGGSSATDNPHTFTMSESLEVKAVFKPILKFPLSGTLEQRGNPLLNFGNSWTYGECPTGTYETHTGIDLTATYGEEVNVAHDGVVKEIYTGQHSKWADAIIVESADGQFTTVYWHVIKYGNLAVNDAVTKGQQIATIANLNSDTHFHFGIRMAPFIAGISDKGALPVSACSGKPGFPEYFINPINITYE